MAYHPQGHFTYEMGNTCSIIDYSIVSQAIWPYVWNFQIATHDPILSDHSLLITEMDIARHRHHPQSTRTVPSPLLKYNWSPEAVDRHKLCLSSPTFTLQIQLLEARTKVENPDIDTLVQDFSKLLLEETKQAVQFRKKGAPSTKQKKWYDQSLKSLKQEVHKLNTQFRNNPSFHLGQQIRDKTKVYK